MFAKMKTYESPQKSTSDKEAFCSLTERTNVLDLKIVFHNERMNVWSWPLKSRKYIDAPILRKLWKDEGTVRHHKQAETEILHPGKYWTRWPTQSKNLPSKIFSHFNKKGRHLPQFRSKNLRFLRFVRQRLRQGKRVRLIYHFIEKNKWESCNTLLFSR